MICSQRQSSNRPLAPSWRTRPTSGSAYWNRSSATRTAILSACPSDIWRYLSQLLIGHSTQPAILSTCLRSAAMTYKRRKYHRGETHIRKKYKGKRRTKDLDEVRCFFVRVLLSCLSSCTCDFNQLLSAMRIFRLIMI